MNNPQYKTISYKISDNPGFLNERNHITPEIGRILQDLHPGVVKGKKHLIKKLNKLCRQYPKVPTFKNQLATLYKALGNDENAHSVNHWLIKEHPGYLYGKINLAAEYLEKGQPEKIPGLLGGAMEIQTFFPDRDEFHIEEVLSFNLIAVFYFLEMDDLDQAKARYEIMENLASDHPNTLEAKLALLEYENDFLDTKGEMFGKIGKELYDEILIKERRAGLQTTTSPTFNFPREMQWLYENSFEIGEEMLKTILGLDRKPLIEDLCAILNDSIARFDFYLEKEEKEGYDQSEYEFPIHAMLLLADLRAEEAIDQVLEIFKQDAEYNDFWFSDYMHDAGVAALFWCGKGQTEKLLEFMKLPGLLGYSQNFVSSAVVKIPEFFPERRDEVIEWSRELIDFYIDKGQSGDFIDSEQMGFLVCDLIDAGLHELLPEIESLFELGLVQVGICGLYQSVEKDIYDENWKNPAETYPILTDIFEKYEDLKKINAPNNMASGGDAFLPKNPVQPVAKPKKTGRNDPCPCGSGKKYKKCCLKTT